MAFPEAKDFNPGSQAWRREVEEKLQEALDKADKATADLAAYRRTNGAAVGAIGRNAGIALWLLNANGSGSQFALTVTPFAYFTTSGYPAAGLKVSWIFDDTLENSMRQATQFQVWVRPVDEGDADGNDIGDVYGRDSQSVTTTPSSPATIRGLEVNTKYAVKVCAVYQAAQGNFSEEKIVTTPNEATKITGPSFTVTADGGVVKATWTGETPAHATAQYTPTGIDLVTPYYTFAVGTRGADGLIYYPENNNSKLGHYLAVDGDAQTATLVQGLATSLSSSQNLQRGHLLPDGRIAYLYAGYNASQTVLCVIDPAAGTVSLVNVGVPTDSVSSVLHSNGNIYSFRNTSSSALNVSIIDSSTLTGTAVSVPTPIGLTWYPAGATEGPDGKIYLASGYWRESVSEPMFAVFDPATNTISYSDFGITGRTDKQMSGAGILHPNGNIYFAPGIYFASPLSPDSNDPASAVVELNPTSGVAQWRAIAPQDGYQFRGHGQSVLGADGRIYWTGVNAATGWHPTLVAYDPSTNAVETIAYPPGAYGTPYYSLGTTEAGRIAGAGGRSGANADETATNDLLIVDGTPAAATPNYLKYQQLERLTASGWVPVTQLVAPGVALDAPGTGTFTYRLVPYSTAGTPGTPSSPVTVRVS